MQPIGEGRLATAALSAPTGSRPTGQQEAYRHPPRLGYDALMLGRTYDGQACSVARALEVVGERWTLLIVRDALHGTTKFDDFLAGLGVSRNVLAARLSRLVDDGILERVRYLERPPRYEYLITAKGRDLAPVVAAFMHWGDTYLAGEDGPPRDIIHNECGGHVRSSMVCSSCGNEVVSGEVRLMTAAPAAESA